jgi:uncharacterized membrane protein YhiD involved in acid resistance
MPEWLLESWHDNVQVRTDELLLRLAAAFVLGCIVAAVYRLTTSHSRGSTLLGTLVLMSVLMAVLTLVVGNSLARAFSLVGSMAIIRFRSVVEETRDTAFVFFAVVAGMACGSGYVLAALAGVPLVLLGAWVFRPRSGAPGEREQLLVIRLGTATAAESRVQAVLKERGLRYRLSALETVRGGAALDVTFVVPPLATDEALALAAELNRIDGVQGMELKDNS